MRTHLVLESHNRYSFRVTIFRADTLVGPTYYVAVLTHQVELICRSFMRFDREEQINRRYSFLPGQAAGLEWLGELPSDLCYTVLSQN